MRKALSTDQAPKAIGPYSQAMTVDGWLFASGQVALDPRTQEMVGTDVETQTEQVFKNLRGVLEAAGATFEHVIKTTVFLKSMDDFARMNAIYARHFEGIEPPARAAVEAARLPKDALVEIELIARLP